MGESKRITSEGRAARAAAVHADAVEAAKDRMRAAASAAGAEHAGAIAARVDEVARAVIEQSKEAA